MTTVLTVLVIAVIVTAATLGVSLVVGRGIRIADEAVAPAGSQIPAPSAAEVADLVDLDALAADDAYVEALADGRIDIDTDPTLTQMFAVWRDEARDGT